MTKVNACLVTDSPAATRAVGVRIGESLRTGDCVALIGHLGAGKTEPVKGSATGAGVPSDVTVNSPTFVMVNEYPGRVRVFHLDAYRLGGAGDLATLGFDEMLAGGGVILFEANRQKRCGLHCPSDYLVDFCGRFARRPRQSGYVRGVQGLTDTLNEQTEPVGRCIETDTSFTYK